MKTFIRYAKNRYLEKSHDWGSPRVRWLWLDALLFAACRCCTLWSPWFRRWCHEVDDVYRDTVDLEFSMTERSGLDCWIDPYWSGESPEEAAMSDLSYWENE